MSYLRRQVSKYLAINWNNAQLSILVVIFFYYFTQNLLLSQNWELLALRSIDDFAINSSVRQMQAAILTGDWSTVFTFFDYAYGNAFWLLNAILLMPLYAIGDVQLQIIAGRQLSLIYVFSSIFLVGLIIDKLYPVHQHLKYPILIAIATMPMVCIISTKLHVNAQCQFFGILAFYLLLREQVIGAKHIFFSGLFAGLAIGMKLTALFITPLLGLTLIIRVFNRPHKSPIKDIGLFSVTLILTALASLAPLILLFPFYISDIQASYETFTLFKNMGANDFNFTNKAKIIDGMAFYLGPIAFLSSIFFYLFLIRNDFGKKNFISSFMFLTFIVTEAILLLIVKKSPSYLASYALNLAFFLPIGLLGLGTFRLSKLLTVAATYAIIGSSILANMDYRKTILYEFDFSDIVNDRKYDQIQTLNHLRETMTPLKKPVSILQDENSLFPASNLDDGVTVVYCYGNLRTFDPKTRGIYDFIALSENFYGKTSPSTDAPRQLTQSEQKVRSQEYLVREILQNEGSFFGLNYQLIFEKNGIKIYQLERN